MEKAQRDPETRDQGWKRCGVPPGGPACRKTGEYTHHQTRWVWEAQNQAYGYHTFITKKKGIEGGGESSTKI